MLEKNKPFTSISFLYIYKIKLYFLYILLQYNFDKLSLDTTALRTLIAEMNHKKIEKNGRALIPDNRRIIKHHSIHSLKKL